VAEEPPRLAEERMRIAVLREQGGPRRLPIWIGATEGDALTVLLRGERLPRPLTIDLTLALLGALGASIERVVVTRLEEKTFYAVVAVQAAGETHDVDARPSDALNLAARSGAPIFVDDAVLDEAGLVGDDVAALLDREGDKAFEGYELPPGEWRAHSIELVTSFWRPPGR
jgi:bifunctional DNase/RNase